jgi:prepilin-type N-terminal cleavage/methylation domain-containing protein
MRMHKLNIASARAGFTLIEMLVVLSIVLVLATLTVLFMPKIAERDRAARAADQLQGWLLIARQWALRDRIPTGVRLQVDSQNANFVRNLQYIQKPENFSQGAVVNWESTASSPLRGFKVDFSAGVDFSGGGQSTIGGDETNLVQAGDFLLFRGEGTPLRITYVQDATSPPPTALYVSMPNPLPLDVPFVPRRYQILRQPRLLAGEQPLQLPQDAAIDLSPFASGPLAGQSHSQNVPIRLVPFGDPLAGSQDAKPYREILFSPSGSVVGQGSATRPIILWVRDVSKDTSAPGLQTLIAIYPTSGLIATHSVAEDPMDPWKYARDGRSSGL